MSKTFLFALTFCGVGLSAPAMAGEVSCQMQKIGPAGPAGGPSRLVFTFDNRFKKIAGNRIKVDLANVVTQDPGGVMRGARDVSLTMTLGNLSSVIITGKTRDGFLIVLSIDNQADVRGATSLFGAPPQVARNHLFAGPCRLSGIQQLVVG